jgi:hypothetical protein
MAFCANCGAAVTDGAGFCGACGKALGTSPRIVAQHVVVAGLAQADGIAHLHGPLNSRSAWVAKEDSRMIKFSFDNIYAFTDGKTSDTHFEGTITKK